MGRQIRVTGKRRPEPDIDKLVAALLRLLEEQAKAAAEQSSKQRAAGSQGSAA